MTTSDHMLQEPKETLLELKNEKFSRTLFSRSHWIITFSDRCNMRSPISTSLITNKSKN